MRILFIGNSFTGRNDLPRLLSEMAGATPEPKNVEPGHIETDQVVANGASLRQHWNAGSAQQKLAIGSWDYVVLQEQSTLPIKNAARFHESVRLFDEVIKQQGAQSVLYLTWARQSAPDTQKVLTEATEAIANELGALIAPVGTAFQEVLRANSEMPLHDKDGSHPSTLGSYLAACVFYAVLFNKSPVGLIVPERLKVQPDHGTLVQQAALHAESGQ